MTLEVKFMARNDKSFVHRLIRWRYLVVVNILIILFLGASLGREVVRNRSINTEISALESEAQELTSRNIEISELKTAMQTESFIEREARLKLGMKKPGETVVVIQEKSGAVQQLTGDESDPFGYLIGTDPLPVAVANPSKWWYYFFDKLRFNQLSRYE